MTGPEDEMAAATRGRLRTSRADRERVIDTLKSAFLQGFLTKDEFDARVGQTFASRTYAELAALTADLGAELMGAPLSRQPGRPADATVADSSQNRVVNAAACVMLAVLVLNTAFFVGNSGVFLAAVAVIAVALLVAGARMMHPRSEQSSRGQQ